MEGGVEIKGWGMVDSMSMGLVITLTKVMNFVQKQQVQKCTIPLWLIEANFWIFMDIVFYRQLVTRPMILMDTR